MLPGIRFLCAAIVLTVSLVIFGLGAAALLRSAHEEFAAIPTRRAPPPTVFAQQTEDPPTLAMLRLEERTAETTLLPTAPVTPATPAAEQASLQLAPVQDAPVEVKVATAPEPTVTMATPVLQPPASIAVAEPEKPQAITLEAPQQAITVAVAPTIAVTPPPSDAVITGSISAVEGEAATLDTQPTATLTDADAKLSSTKIATLGGPPVDTEPVPLPRIRPAAEPVKVKQTVKKRVVVKKRRVAVAPAPVQQTDPFGQPLAR